MSAAPAPSDRGHRRTTVRAHAGPSPLPRAVLAQAVMELRLLWRSAESLVVTLGIPVGILVFFSVVDVLPTGEGDPAEFLVPGVLAISVMSTAFVAQAIQTAFERKYGVLKRLGGTPLPRSGFLAAKVLAVVAVLAVQTLLILGIARFGLGWQAAGGSVGLVLAGLVVGTFTFAALGLLLAGAASAEATLALANAIYLLLLLISGLAIDLDALPGPLAEFAVALPSGALGAVLREALGTATDTPPGGSAAVGMLVLAAWGVAAAVATARTFRWDP